MPNADGRVQKNEQMQALFDELREEMSDLEHKRWSHWTTWQFSVCVHNPDGTLTIPKELVERWERQAGTSYRFLSEREKDSDRQEADKTLALIGQNWVLTRI